MPNVLPFHDDGERFYDPGNSLRVMSPEEFKAWEESLYTNIDVDELDDWDDPYYGVGGTDC